jgi:hypothetical protein
MARAVPGTEGSENVRIHVVDRIRRKDLVRSSFSPPDELIEKGVRRNPTIGDAVFRGFVAIAAS